MKNALLFLFVVLIAAGSVQAQKFTLLHTNDMHSRLVGYAPSSDYSPEVTGNDETLGGFARLAGYFQQVEDENGEKPLILDGGDFLMGTLFHTLEPQEGFQLRLMKQMGYDVVAIGNHEFDLGVEQLGEIIARSTIRGEIPKLVLSNIRFHPEDPSDDLLADLYRKGVVQTALIHEYKGLRIGFFGLMGDEAAEVAPYAKPAVFTDRIAAAEEMTQYLKNFQRADLIICLSHSGLLRDKKGHWTGEDVDLAEEVDGIDLIISGHSHSQLMEPLLVNNTPIVQAGSEGRFAGRMDVEWDGEQLQVHDYVLKVMDDQMKGVAHVQREIDAYEQRIMATVFSDLQLEPGKVICETGFDLTLNENNKLETSNLGPLVADAIHWHVNQVHHSDVTLAVAGLIRDNMMKGSSGQQLANDLFRITPLGSGVTDDSPGYSLAQVYVTARELKSIFEVMLLAPKLSTSNFPYWSGVKFSYNPMRFMLDKVYEISLGNESDGYTPIDISRGNEQLYSVTTNNYVLEFFGLIDDITFGLLKVAPKNEFGEVVSDLNTLVLDGHPDQPGYQEMKEWEALIRYTGQFPDLNGNGIADIPDYYQQPKTAGQKNTSLHPVKLLSNTNGITAGVGVIAAGILAATGLLIFL